MSEKGPEQAPTASDAIRSAVIERRDTITPLLLPREVVHPQLETGPVRIAATDTVPVETSHRTVMVEAALDASENRETREQKCQRLNHKHNSTVWRIAGGVLFIPGVILLFLPFPFVGGVVLTPVSILLMITGNPCASLSRADAFWRKRIAPALKRVGRWIGIKSKEEKEAEEKTALNTKTA